MIISSLREKVLSMAPVRADSIEKLVDYALAVQNLCSVIDACGRKEYMRDVTLMQELVCKLPSAIKLDWARHSKSLVRVTLMTFSDWIFSIAEDASIVANPRKYYNFDQDHRGKRQGKAFINTHAASSSSETVGQRLTTGNRVRYSESGNTTSESSVCPTCKGNCRTVAKCKRFIDLSAEEPIPCSSQRKANEGRSINTHQVEAGVELFRYLPVTLFGPNTKVDCFAFLDDGSELTLLDEQISKELELVGDTTPLCLRWTGGTHRFADTSRQVNLGISGLNGRRFDLNGVRTVASRELPFQSLDVELLKRKYAYLDGVPVKSYNRVRPRILIGVKHANISLVRRCREGKDGEPIAVKTRLGWTIFGWRSNPEKVDGNYSYHICECSLQNESQLHQEVKQYFCLDSLGIMKPTNTTVSIDDERALSLLNSLTRTVENKYETGLLWRFDSIRLPDSRPMALQRLRCLQRRLAKDNDLRLAYNAKLAEYEQKGYIKKVVPEELAARKGQVWYLPTFPVINPNKPGKIRIVWDAAATVRGVSLNSVLLTGPDLLSSLVAVLHKFREYRVGICGDIREMFLQIGIRPEDQFYQLFFWNEDSSEREPSTFIVPVMIFGACSSPTTAQFVKNKNAQRFREEFPLAVEAVENKHYVDDMLASTETEAEAIELAKSVKYIHAQGGFDIRNWVSNSAEVLKALGEKPMNEMALNIVAEYATEKVLGMWWNTSTDCFIYKICWTRFDAKLFDGSRPPTKRELLRILMSIFDPLGLISHFLMALKVTLQDIWRIGLKWDDQIESKQLDSWKTWTERLPKLEELQIPRCYRQITSIGDRNRVQLHTFVDAGENGMAAVVYLRFEEDGHIECALVAAKTRVAPLKYLSTPRSEIQAAVIGARLADSIIKSLSIHVLRRFFWCDSCNVLCWLRSDHRRYSQYVAARVSEILDITEVNDCNWIKLEQNVADDGTKWTKHIQLRCSDRWFKGPEFLKQPEPKWPIIHSNQETTTEELRSTALVNTHIKAEEPVVIATKYSNWKRLLKVTAYVKRFVDNIRAKQHQQSSQHGPLVSAELQWAQLYHFRQAQQNVYNEELKILAVANGDGHQKRLSTNSRIYKMSPFLGADNVLRMNSRAAKCTFLYPDEKYPISPPKLRDSYKRGSPTLLHP
ncbi:uncharacterized protein LOC134221657 [Armigeres subalbatus]|uniref:uncharacterized protein LOC134221657 n=1 Tax=Armigeres subalbatus TaxID=124917 RepID=UPI002ED65E5F